MTQYYKIIKDGEFIGIASTYEMQTFQEKHHIIVACEEDKAQFIMVSGQLYRDNWMRPLTSETAYIAATVIRISEEEYQDLFEAVESGEEIPVEEETTEEETYIDPNEQTTIEYVREAKVASLSRICESVITGGFDIVLADGEEHHFSLTVQDQINLMFLKAAMEAGETLIPYHPDNEPCVFYTTQDATAIIEYASQFKTYHTTYFNSLKHYVNALGTVHEINAVQYGDVIPYEYQSEVLKSLFNA